MKINLAVNVSLFIMVSIAGSVLSKSLTSLEPLERQEASENWS